MKRYTFIALLIFTSGLCSNASAGSAEQIIRNLQRKYAIDVEAVMEKGMYYAANETARWGANTLLETFGHDIPILSGYLKRQQLEAVRKNNAIQSQVLNLQKMAYLDSKQAERAVVSAWRSGKVIRLADEIIENLLDPMPSYYSALTARSERVRRDISYCTDSSIGLRDRVKRFEKTDEKYLNREIVEENIAICLATLSELEKYKESEEKIIRKVQRQLRSTPDDDSSSLEALKKEMHRSMDALRSIRAKKQETNDRLLDLRERISAIKSAQKRAELMRKARAEMWQHLPDNKRPATVEEEDAWEAEAYHP